MANPERVEYRSPVMGLIKVLLISAALLAGCIYAASVWGYRGSMGVLTFKYYAAVFIGTPFCGLLFVGILAELILRPAFWAFDHDGIWVRTFFRPRLLPWKAVERIAVTIGENGRSVEVTSSCKELDSAQLESLQRGHGRSLRIVPPRAKLDELEPRLSSDAVAVARDIAARCAAAGNAIEPHLAEGVLDPMWETHGRAKAQAAGMAS
jgi:hypothetical protein